MDLLRYLASRVVITRKDVLSVGLLAAIVGIVSALFRYQLPPANQDALLLVLGALLMRLADVYSFEFGSTRASEVKDVRLNDVTQRALDAIPAMPARPEAEIPTGGPAGPVQEPPRG